MSDDFLEITEQELIDLVKKQNFTDRQRAPQQAFGLARVVAGPNKGWASQMSPEFTPDLGKFMAGYQGSKTFTELELLAMAALPDELLGKIVGAARGGVNALHGPLSKISDMVVRVRTGHLLDGILLLDSNPNATAQRDALEVIALAYDAWTKKGKDLGDESGWIYDTAELNLLQQVETEQFEDWLGMKLSDPVLRGLNAADALNDSALSAYREADSKNIALAVGILAISLGKTILRKDKGETAYKFFVKTLVVTIIEYLETGGYSNAATEARSYIP